MRDVADLVRLVREASSGQVLAGVPLANLGSWRIGGLLTFLSSPNRLGMFSACAAHWFKNRFPTSYLGLVRIFSLPMLGFEA